MTAPEHEYEHERAEAREDDRGLPDLTRLGLRALRREGAGSALDVALERALAADAATTRASSGFQSRI